MKGKLILTNARLIFTAGHFQDITSAFSGAHKDRVEMPLNAIVNVERGFMATITFHSGEKYTFRGMGDADGWVDAINRARLQSHATSFAPAPQRMPPLPGQAAAGNRFRGRCGAPVQ